jgi:hypothetical protein
MSKHSVPASDVSELLRRFAELRRKAAARTGWDTTAGVVIEGAVMKEMPAYFSFDRP